MDEHGKLESLIESYMEANPDSENPMSNIYVFGVSGLIELLEKAENRPIEFRIKKDVLDGIFAYIDGKRV